MNIIRKIAQFRSNRQIKKAVAEDLETLELYLELILN